MANYSLNATQNQDGTYTVSVEFDLNGPMAYKRAQELANKVLTAGTDVMAPPPEPESEGFALGRGTAMIGKDGHSSISFGKVTAQELTNLQNAVDATMKSNGLGAKLKDIAEDGLLGGVAGAAIGTLAGDTKKGAMIGAGAGAAVGAVEDKVKGVASKVGGLFTRTPEEKAERQKERDDKAADKAREKKAELEKYDLNGDGKIKRAERKAVDKGTTDGIAEVPPIVEAQPLEFTKEDKQRASGTVAQSEPPLVADETAEPRRAPKPAKPPVAEGPKVTFHPGYNPPAEFNSKAFMTVAAAELGGIHSHVNFEDNKGHYKTYVIDNNSGLNKNTADKLLTMAQQVKNPSQAMLDVVDQLLLAKEETKGMGRREANRYYDKMGTAIEMALNTDEMQTALGALRRDGRVEGVENITAPNGGAGQRHGAQRGER